jgi:NADH:ubiquinone oxidoreductase subunit B-like Fe-S oxidoreductase
MADPKFVIVVGSCGISGGVFRDCYNVHGGVDKIVPVDLYIPGCPPRPEAIVFGVYKLLQALQGVEE